MVADRGDTAGQGVERVSGGARETAQLLSRDRQVVDHDNLTKSRTPAEAIQAALVLGQTAINFAPHTLAETKAALARVCTVLEHSTTARGPRND